MSLGQGTVSAMSSKQKIDTRSSTEAELAGVNQPLPMILWSKLFCNAQGMNMTDNMLHQDNKSAIRMEKHGKASCKKRTKHIQIRCFCMTDAVKSGDISVEHCPTTEMIGDCFGEPLTGLPFKKFRNVTLGIDERDMKECREACKRSTNARCKKE